MKTTIDLPESLLRKAKATAALRGRKLRELVVDGLERMIAEPDPATAPRAISAYEMMKDYCGAFDSGIEDLGSNPKHLEGFGK
jgi:hypothetical protein